MSTLLPTGEKPSITISPTETVQSIQSSPSILPDIPNTRKQEEDEHQSTLIKASIIASSVLVLLLFIIICICKFKRRKRNSDCRINRSSLFQPSIPCPLPKSEEKHSTIVFPYIARKDDEVTVMPGMCVYVVELFSGMPKLQISLLLINIRR